jgi:predicted metal-dependent hydrolase
MLDNNFRYLVAKRYGFREASPDFRKRSKSDMGQDEIERGQDGETALKQGTALFNAGDYFHAHEVWEGWWRATTHPEKQTIQGMIQVAVAMHHASARNFAGAASVIERALRNLESAEEHWRGLHTAQLRADLRHALLQLTAGQGVTHFKIEFG